ncbi:ESX-1 secretion-associated protein EspI-like [Heliangelus exortis]|uniref:ESX-1 secretion-associated protein EspI-like n=1 Tax=Heliangelus exortis TaxID=472823 RepID=UPI003A90E6BE
MGKTEETCGSPKEKGRHQIQEALETATAGHSYVSPVATLRLSLPVKVACPDPAARRRSLEQTSPLGALRRGRAGPRYGAVPPALHTEPSGGIHPEPGKDVPQAPRSPAPLASGAPGVSPQRVRAAAPASPPAAERRREAAGSVGAPHRPGRPPARALPVTSAAPRAGRQPRDTLQAAPSAAPEGQLGAGAEGRAQPGPAVALGRAGGHPPRREGEREYGRPSTGGDPSSRRRRTLPNLQLGPPRTFPSTFHRGDPRPPPAPPPRAAGRDHSPPPGPRRSPPRRAGLLRSGRGASPPPPACLRQPLSLR